MKKYFAFPIFCILLLSAFIIFDPVDAKQTQKQALEGVLLSGDLKEVTSFEQNRSFDCTGRDVPQTECEALVALYEDTDGANWTTNTNWLTDSLIANWYGVYVFEGNVYSLNLNSNHLNGTIPEELGNLPELNQLYLRFNASLTGPIPTTLGNLTKLNWLQLDSSNLNGSIPAELGNLSNLQYLYLGDNQLTGSIPAELGDLSNLTFMYLSYNNLNGAIPPDLGDLVKLKTMRLDGNDLTGTIPPELGDLSALDVLDLSNNALTGTIPSQLGNLSTLRTLYLSENELEGTIPDALGNLASLEYLRLSHNDLEGVIPAELSYLTNLKNLYLDNNSFTGEIPAFLGTFSGISLINMSNNLFYGSIPENLGNLINLYLLDLSHNTLTGLIPAAMGDLDNMQFLYLNNNQLSGGLPAELGNLTNLMNLYVDTNQLSGAIPMSFIGLTNLSTFYFRTTDLCEPPYTDFQDWKATVYSWSGTDTLCGEICSISGTVTYEGDQGYKPITVALLVDPDEKPIDELVVESEDGTYPYDFSVYWEGSYYIGAFIDLNGNDQPDPDEPFGVYDLDEDGTADPINVTVGSEPITGIDFEILDPVGGSISGRVSCGGILAGSLNTVYVDLWMGGAEGEPDITRMIGCGDPYLFGGLAPGAYVINAWMDLDDSGGPPDDGEPMVWYDENMDGETDPIEITDLEAVTGIDLILAKYPLYLPLILR